MKDGGVVYVLESEWCRASARGVCAGGERAGCQHERGLPAVQCKPEDRLQVAAAVQGSRAVRAGGSEPASAVESPVSEWILGTGVGTTAAGASALGSEEAAAAAVTYGLPTRGGAGCGDSRTGTATGRPE